MEEKIRKLRKIFIASPSDLPDERQSFRDVVIELSKIKANSIGVEIEPVGWEDTIIGYTKRVQERINKDITECDLIVFAFWKRWGTPTGKYSSGCEEEFELARSLRKVRGNHPDIFLFFKTIPEEFLVDPGEQLKQVLAFRERVTKENKHLIGEFDTIQIWRKELRKQIAKYLDEKYPCPSGATPQGKEDAARRIFEIRIKPVLAGVDLRNEDLSGIDMGGYDLQGANLGGANLKDTILTNANLVLANLNRTNLRGANLAGANLRNATLLEADLTASDLRECVLQKVELKDAILTGINGARADFSEAILSNTNMQGANLTGAKLLGATLYRTNLAEAIVNDVEMGWTVLGNLDLSNVVGLDNVIAKGQSSIAVDTIFKSKGKIPNNFLRFCGIPEDFIRLIPSLFYDSITYYSCFISYSSQDEDFARRLHSDLQAAKVRVWFAPDDMKVGDKIWDRIDQSIRAFDKLLVVFSSNAAKSDWIEYEVGAALEQERIRKKHVLFPIRLDDAVMDTDKPWAAKVRQRHIGDFTDWKNHDSYKKAFDRLLRDLKASEE